MMPGSVTSLNGSTGTARGTTPSVALINRELTTLRRAFRLGVEQERIASIPTIKLLAGERIREGFVEPDQAKEIARRLPEPLDDVARFGYISGWRKQEILTLCWSDVDMDHRLIRLRRENSKSEEPRVLVLTDELLELMQRRWASRQYQTPTGPALSQWVFHRKGRRLVDFRKQWRKAVSAAGMPTVIFHDYRRSAVRNLERAGVSQAVAMKLSGHKTDSVYRRYRVVDEKDIELALRAAQKHNRQAPTAKVMGLTPVQGERSR